MNLYEDKNSLAIKHESTRMDMHLISSVTTLDVDNILRTCDIVSGAIKAKNEYIFNDGSANWCT
jgi:hypothetical protein